MKRRSAAKPRRMRKTPRGQQEAPAQVLSLRQPSKAAELPQVHYRRVWP